LRKDLDPGYYQPLYAWALPFTSARLSVFLVITTLCVLSLPTPEKAELFWLAGQQSVFALVVIVIQQYLPVSVAAVIRTLLVSVAMVAFVLSVAITMRVEAVAMLLFVPVINAALRASGRGLLFVMVLSGAGWIYVQTVNDSGGPWAWIPALIGVATMILVAYIMNMLKDDADLVQNRLTALAHQDELTGTLNMRAFTRLLMSLHARAEQSKDIYALLMVDIKNLQSLNEKYGHEQGNKAICAISEALKRSIRSNDLLARYGGDEFIIYLAGAGDEVAQAVTNRIAQNVYNITMSFDRGTEKVEVHTGTAIFPDSGDTVQDMMGIADKAMYREKEFRQRAIAPQDSSNIGREQAGLEPR
jgi:diguanylate cyclase (GGDEF)-like protein